MLCVWLRVWIKDEGGKAVFDGVLTVVGFGMDTIPGYTGNGHLMRAVPGSPLPSNREKASLCGLADGVPASSVVRRKEVNHLMAGWKGLTYRTGYH